MAELARPVSYGVNPTIFNPQPVPIGPFAVDQRKSAKAALLGTIAQALGELPGKLLAAYQEGQKARTGNIVRREYEQALAGQPTKSGAALSDFQATSGGAVTLNAEDPALRAAKANYYNRPSPAEQKPALYNYLNKQFEGGTPGTPLGKVTDYGQPNDAFKDTNSNIKKIGAWDNPLEAGVSLAVSPDVRAQFEASGIKPRDMVNLRTADGKTIQARWDDLTANDEEAKQIGLPPLRGRFDIYSPQGPHALRDTGIVGFEKAGVPADRQAQIGTAAADAGMQLASVPPTALSASTAPGPVPAANIAPLANVPVKRPTLGRDPKTGAIIYAPTPTEVTAVFPTGDKIDISPPAASQRETMDEKVDEKLALEGYDVKTMTPEQKQGALKALSGGKRLTEGEQKTSIYLERATAANENISKVLERFDPTTEGGALKSKAAGTIFNKLAGDDAQLLKQAADEFAMAILRKDTGAAITTSERKHVYDNYIPQYGDTLATLKQKSDARARAIAALQGTIPPSAGGTRTINPPVDKVVTPAANTTPATSDPSTWTRMLKPGGDINNKNDRLRVPPDKVEDAKKLGATLIQ